MIKLDDEFTLESDANNWTLHYRKEGKINEKTGTPAVTENFSYHGHIKFALQKYMSEALKPCESISELLTKINDIENEILLLRINH